MPSKKAAIELSMSFLVMLIIAVVVFVLSLAFLKTFFFHTNEMGKILDQRTKLQIDEMLLSNTRIAIPMEEKTIKKGDGVCFWMGIRNTLTTTKFIAEMSGGSFIPDIKKNILVPLNCLPITGRSCRLDCQNTVGCPNDVSAVRDDILSHYMSKDGKFNIPNGKSEMFNICFTSNKDIPEGHYIFNMRFCAGDNTLSSCVGKKLYDNTPYKIHIFVK